MSKEGTEGGASRERRRPTIGRRFRALFFALLLLGGLATGLNACSDDDINFPGDLPPVPPTAEPTDTPDPDA